MPWPCCMWARRLILPVEIHATALLFAIEEGTVVLLEVPSTITNASVGGIAANLGAEENTVVSLHDYCVQSWGYLLQGAKVHCRHRYDGN